MKAVLSTAVSGAHLGPLRRPDLISRRIVFKILKQQGMFLKQQGMFLKQQGMFLKRCRSRWLGGGRWRRRGGSRWRRGTASWTRSSGCLDCKSRPSHRDETWRETHDISLWSVRGNYLTELCIIFIAWEDQLSYYPCDQYRFMVPAQRRYVDCATVSAGGDQNAALHLILWNRNLARVPWNRNLVCP